MREIKFRVWDKPDMFYFDKFDFNTELFEVSWECKNPPKMGGWGTELGDGFTLMQFTGLHDKNGKEIYEGDIVLGKNGGQVVEWKEMCDETVCFSGFGLPWLDEERLVILGNIYENPELLQ